MSDADEIVVDVDESGTSLEEAATEPTFTLKQVEAMMAKKMGGLEKQLAELTGRVPARKETELSETARLKATVRELEADKNSRIAAERDHKVRSSTRDALTSAGVAPHLLDAAEALLVDKQKVVTLEEDGNVSWGGESSLSDGIKRFMSSQQGKAFLAPKGAAGSGDRRLGGTKGAGDNTIKVTGEDLSEMLLKALQG